MYVMFYYVINFFCYFLILDENLTVHYLIIGTSLCGIVFLIYGIRRLLANNEDISDNDFPRYAPLYHEEMLQDLPQNK